VNLLEETLARVVPVDPRIGERTAARLDEKTKPQKSLGRLEELACRVAEARGQEAPPLPRKAIVVMGADHGVAAEGVSAYPQEVTAQMLLNFARGGAAINVLARHAGAEVIVVDMGVRAPCPTGLGIRDGRIGPGTQSITRGPAMRRDEAIRAIEVGIGIASELAEAGVTLIGIGEMGIGNTTSASALTAALLALPPEEVTGRGTGVDDAGLARKLAAIRRGLEVNRPSLGDVIGTLAALGGFEIAGLVGVALGAAARRVPVVVDGFIASVAALVALRLTPALAGYLIASHASVEVGHRAVFRALGQAPLLDLDMRLGEGTGAALAMGLVDASLRVLHEMATFASAGVSDAGA
jgi:nicotinate-nucleotide--dimethylbenzimidazole phosphoribosyltransferase